MTAPTLTEFLLARIAEDEAVAQRGLDGFSALSDGTETCHTVSCGVGLGYWANDRCECGVPARILAECEAKRRIVEDVHFDGRSGEHIEPWCASCSDDENLVYLPCATLALLAMPYSDHPDYDEAWRP